MTETIVKVIVVALIVVLLAGAFGYIAGLVSTHEAAVEYADLIAKAGYYGTGETVLHSYSPANYVTELSAPFLGSYGGLSGVVVAIIAVNVFSAAMVLLGWIWRIVR